jgi:SAM-dependent methyltransferase
MDQNNIPEGDRIYDLYTGIYKPQIIRIALKLDVFSPLVSGPANAEVIAKACKCELIGICHLLNYLTSLDILVKQEDKYSLSPEAGTFLVRGKKAYTGDLIMDFVGPAPWESLQESIRGGQPHNIDLEIHFAQDAWIESYRLSRIPGSLEMWSKAGIVPQRRDRFRILDLACGCAIKSMVLAKNSPNVVLTCLDTPLVLEAAHDLASRWGILPQVRITPDNLLTADLGKAQYEACLVGQISHYLTVQQNNDLFKRIYRALVPGGVLLLDVPMTTEKLDESSRFLSLLLWANSGGRAYTFNEYRSWLLTSSFITIHQHSERLLSAVR